MNEPWECPRCFRMNAPFNPTCFCKPEDEGYLIQHPKDEKPSEHVMDAANYLTGSKQTKVNWPKGQCLICGMTHNHGQHCATLQNNIPPNGEFI